MSAQTESEVDPETVYDLVAMLNQLQDDVERLNTRVSELEMQLDGGNESR